ARRLQDAAPGRVRRRAPPQQHGQGPQARVARIAVTATFTGPSEFLRIHARHRGDAIALVDAGLDRTLTFGELDTRVNQLAHALFARGLGAGDRIAVLATDSHQFLETILACTRTGIAYVALNVRLLETALGTLVGRGP